MDETPLRPPDRLRRRHVSDAVRVMLGGVLLAVASLPIRPDAVGTSEAGSFAAVNALPDMLFPLLWAPMQLGSLSAVPLVMAAALLTRRRWLAVEAALAGTAAWTLAKVVKDAFGRPRPGGLLDEVAFRGGEPVGFGFVSGHSAVAFALATAATLYLPRRWRPAAFGLAALVGIARIYVGAHLPLDVVGGAALGWATAAAVRMVIGAATGRPSIERVQTGLSRLGLDGGRLEPIAAHAGTAAVYRLCGRRDGELFVKVLSDRPQDRDLLHRWWLRLTRRVPPDDRRAGSPLQQVLWEATATLAAHAAGVRVPVVVFAGRLDADHAVLVTTWVDGTVLSDMGRTDDESAGDLSGQVAALHAAGIAHGDLTAPNVIVARGQATLLDFGDATLAASAAVMESDREALARLLAAARSAA